MISRSSVVISITNCYIRVYFTLFTDDLREMGVTWRGRKWPTTDTDGGIMVLDVSVRNRRNEVKNCVMDSSLSVDHRMKAMRWEICKLRQRILLIWLIHSAGIS